MSARHRRPAPPRVATRRLVGAGAVGLTAAFALAPLAVAAADPVDTSSADTGSPDSSSPAAPVVSPSSDAPTSGAPSSDAPSSSSSDAPSSGSSAPSSAAPSSAAPSSDAPSSDAPSPSTPSSSSAPAPTHATSAPKPRAVAPKAFAPELGLRKIRVGVQLKTGAYVPPGSTTVGSVIQFVQHAPDGSVDGATLSCTTDTVDTPGAVTSYCGTLPNLNDADSIVVTQVSAPAGFVVDPNSATIAPCTVGGTPGPSCFVGPVVLTDAGIAPTTTDDTASVLTGGTVDVPVLKNDDLAGAPVTGMTISGAPQHGTATVVPPVTAPPVGPLRAALAGPSTPVIRYVAKAGYVGSDSLTYTVTTANGSATGTLAITVLAPPPTATNDSARTTEGHAVTVDVTANDDAHGGGALRVDSVTHPAHGSVRIVGTDVVYTPAAGFSGTDRFRYVVATGYGTDSATVTVRVAADHTSTPTTPSSPSSSDNGTGNVANTGTDSAELVGLAGGLLLAGGAATVIGRHRRPRRAH